MHVYDSRLFKHPTKIKGNLANMNRNLYTIDSNGTLATKQMTIGSFKRKLSTRYKRATQKTLWQLGVIYPSSL